MHNYLISIDAEFLNESELKEVLDANPQVFQPPRKFLFVSEDGVDLFEGDDYTLVDTTDGKCFSSTTVFLYQPILPNGILAFSNHELAQRVALTYKKQFSLQDLQRVMDEDGNIAYRDLL